jgi:hypothetical protein
MGNHNQEARCLQADSDTRKSMLAGPRSEEVGFAHDSALEEDGFEPSVPLVSRGAIRREFPKRGARLAASWGVELRRRSSIWEFDPTSRDQTRGILLRHLDDAIQADGDMPV